MTDTPHDDIANLTLMHLRRLEAGQKQILEIVQRHDLRLGRVERDMGELRRDIAELKSDQITLENQLLNRMNEILRVVERLDEHELRLQRLEVPAQGE